MSDLDGNQSKPEIVNDRPLSNSEDIELDIREALEELKSKDAPDKEVVDTEASGTEAGEVEAPATTSTRVRDASGKFVKAEGQPTDMASPEATPQPTQTGPIKPPSTWTVEGKEFFLKQPPEVQKELLKRSTDMERHFHQVTQEAARVRNEYADIDEAIKPYEAKWHLEGVSRGQAIRSLAAAHAYLEQDLKGGLEWIAKSYGTSLAALAAAEEGESPINSTNSNLQPLMAKIQSLEEKLSQQEQASRASSQNSLVSELHAVRDEVGQDGKYLRPELHDESFVQKLVPVMQGLVQAYPGESPRVLLARAYTAATGKNPQRVQAQNGHTQKARQASLSVPGGIAAQKPQEPLVIPDSATETARQVAREMGLI